jgi:hypothetical protein
MDFDIEVVNASTGAQVPLPAGVNTTADELHPSISADGSRLVFERRDNEAGTIRIIALDLPSGQSSDLFTGFEASQDQPSSPAITPDGQTVGTGGPFQQSGAGSFVGGVTFTSLAPFPSGPYTHTLHGLAGSNVTGQVPEVGSGPNGAFGLVVVFDGGHELLGTVEPGISSGVDPIPAANASLNPISDPVLQANNPQFMLFVRRDGPVFFSQSDIEFLPVTPEPNSTFNFDSRTPTRLPAAVDTSADESQPALTADGRFVAFVRHGSGGHDRLFLWDSQTQLLVNPDGVDLGAITSRDVGNVALYTQPVFSIGQVSISQVSNVALANVEARLTVHGGVGILVQRIVGRHRILGRREYKLRMVGRVPLGFFKKGRHHLHWNLRVNGRPLRPGRYLVTLRALSRQGVVRDLAKPDVIRVRRGR